MNNTQTHEPSSYYAECRNIAKLTQEQALPFLKIQDVSTLSRYENMKVQPPNDVVERMVTLYRITDLMTWHIRYWFPEFVPYIIEPTKITSNETFQSNVVRSKNIIADLENVLNISLMDDVLDEKERIQLTEKKPLIDLAIEKLVAVRNHIGTLADSE